MAQQSARPKASNLALRVLSAAVLLPLALLVIWGGGLVFAAFMMAVCALLLWEWMGLSGAERAPAAVAGALAVAVAILLMHFQLTVPAFGALALGAATAFGLGWRREGAAALIAGFGVAYVGVAGLSAVWLRLRPDNALWFLLFIVAVVVATDVGAYVAGRLIGGPKLAPRISPNKTWAGLMGGMLAAAGSAWLLGHQIESAGWVLFLFGALIAVVAQLGDLLESHLKRRAGVKDSGAIIPGHGGVLDRLDGFLAAMPTMALVVWSFGGPAAWR